MDLNCEPVVRNKKSMDRNKVPIRIPCREIIRDKYGVYEVCGYLGPTQEENLFSFLERLSKTIDTECKKVDRIIKMPIFVQKIVLFYEKNHRIEQYIQKKYLTQEEQIFWRYRMPVALYDL